VLIIKGVVTLGNASQPLTSADRRAQRIGIGLRHLAERSLGDISTDLVGEERVSARRCDSGRSGVSSVRSSKRSVPICWTIPSRIQA
jgi:hypothetical protein